MVKMHSTLVYPFQLTFLYLFFESLCCVYFREKSSLNALPFTFYVWQMFKPLFSLKISILIAFFLSSNVAKLLPHVFKIRKPFSKQCNKYFSKPLGLISSNTVFKPLESWFSWIIGFHLKIYVLCICLYELSVLYSEWYFLNFFFPFYLLFLFSALDLVMVFFN